LDIIQISHLDTQKDTRSQYQIHTIKKLDIGVDHGCLLRGRVKPVVSGFSISGHELPEEFHQAVWLIHNASVVGRLKCHRPRDNNGLSPVVTLRTLYLENLLFPTEQVN
jgi:hypothetical protein